MARRVRRPMSFLLLLSAGILSAVTTPPATANENDTGPETVRRFIQAHDLFQQGEDRYARREFETAAALLRQCLDLFPRHDRAHFLLAGIRLRQHRLAEAEAHIRDAERAFAQFQQWYRENFRKYLGELRRKQVDNRLRLSVLGEQNSTSYCGTRRPITYTATALRSQNSAIEAILSAFSPRGDEIPADYHYVHGNILFLSGRRTEAAEEYRRALEGNPRHGAACYNLANIYFIRRQYRQAREYLQRARAAGFRVNPEFDKALAKAEP